jgi:hypothetical protein
VPSLGGPSRLGTGRFCRVPSQVRCVLRLGGGPAASPTGSKKYRWRRNDPQLDRKPLHLGFDQLAQRLLVAITECLRIEVAGPALDDHRGDGDHFRVDRQDCRGHRFDPVGSASGPSF